MKKARILTYHKMYPLEYLKFTKWINSENERIKKLADFNEIGYTEPPKFYGSQKKLAMWLLQRKNKKELTRLGNLEYPFKLVTEYLKKQTVGG